MEWIDVDAYGEITYNDIRYEKNRYKFYLGENEIYTFINFQTAYNMDVPESMKPQFDEFKRSARYKKMQNYRINRKLVLWNSKADELQNDKREDNDQALLPETSQKRFPKRQRGEDTT